MALKISDYVDKLGQLVGAFDGRSACGYYGCFASENNP